MRRSSPQFCAFLLLGKADQGITFLLLRKLEVTLVIRKLHGIEPWVRRWRYGTNVNDSCIRDLRPCNRCKRCSIQLVGPERWNLEAGNCNILHNAGDLSCDRVVFQ